MSSDALSTLQSAFFQIIKDAHFLAEAERRGIEINQPVDGAEALSIVTHVYSAKPELIQKAIAATNPANPAKTR